MAAAERIHTSQETLELLREKAKDQDVFSVKVFRRKHISMAPDLIANLSGAVLEHLVNPELWLPQLCGGGKIQLQVFHPPTDLNKPIGGMLMVPIENVDVKEVDPAATSRAGWRGPADIVFPLKSERPQQGADVYGIHSPPGPVPPDSASSATQRWSRSPGGGVIRENYGDNPDWDRTPRGLALVEAERRKLEEEKLAAERERAREKLDSQQKAHEAEMKAFRAEMMAELRAQKASVPTGPDPIVEMLKQQAEDRRAAETRAAEDRRAADLQRAEDRRLAQAAADRAEERFLKMLEKLTDKPKENPLEMVAKVAEILHKGNSNEASMKMMHNMAEMHSVQMDTAMNFIEHAANLQMGGQENEPGWVKGLESVVKSVGSMAKGIQIKRPNGVQQQPQLPAPQTYAQQAQQQPAQQPVPVQQYPKPPPAPPKGPPPPVFQQFLDAIKRGGTDTEIPVEQITASLLKNLTDPSLIEAFADAGNDSDVLFDKHLNNWANISPTNRAYLKALKAEIEKQFRAAGIIAPDEGDDQGDDDQGDEGSDQQDEGDEDDGA